MEITREYLLQEIENVTRLRDDYLADAQQQIAAFNGGIKMAEAMLKHLEKEDPIAQNGDASATAAIAESSEEDNALAAVGDSVQNHTTAVVTEEEPEMPATLPASADTAESDEEARAFTAENGEVGQSDISSSKMAMNAGTHHRK